MGKTDFAAALATIRLRFLDRLAGQAADIDRLLNEAEKPERAAESLEEICTIAHKIAGLARSVGFADLGEKAFAADSEIRKWQNAGMPEGDSEAVMAIVAEFRSACDGALKSSAA